MLAEETIDRVRREARIVTIIGERVKLSLRGRSHTGLCPFHKEKTPSFHVNEERGFYHCFGCSASGDAIKFLREMDGLSFVDAIRYIAERQGIEILETGSEDERREHAEARRRREELFAAGEVAASYFEKMLSTHPLAGFALEELTRRGLDYSEKSGPAAEALAAFRIGYAPYGWDGFVKHLKSGAAPVRAAESVGLIVPRKSGPGHYDRFRHRLMFAIIDLDGKIIGFSGRALAEPSTEQLGAAGFEPMSSTGEPPAKYLNSPESPVYKKREAVFGLFQARQSVRREERAIVVEGNFDVVSLHARGVTNTVAPLGTAFTSEQAQQLKRYAHRVTLFFDGDSAGKRAVLAAREPCREAGLDATVATPPEDKDPDLLVREGGKEAILRVVKASRSMLEYMIDSTLEGASLGTDAHGLGARIRAVGELIRAEEDPATRALAERHADAIAERLGIGDARSLAALASAVQRATSGRVESTQKALPAPPERARSPSRRDDIGREVFGSLLDFPELLETPEVAEATQAIEGDAALAIAALRHDPGLVQNPEQLLAKLPRPIHSFAAARLAAPRHPSMDDARSELLGNVEKLKRLELSRQKLEVIEELTRARDSGDDFAREMTLLAEQARRAREARGL
ncbi:MAG TPA: DNA primase [Polyangiaceae bacterium]|jgi:DNA primase|nr:DNA primase [Polyangiaceae bacterium]